MSKTGGKKKQQRKKIETMLQTRKKKTAWETLANEKEISKSFSFANFVCFRNTAEYYSGNRFLLPPETKEEQHDREKKKNPTTTHESNIVFPIPGCTSKYVEVPFYIEIRKCLQLFGFGE